MVFRSFPKLHQNGPVSHKISPPNSCFIKLGASFPGFYFLQITRLARLPLLTPRTITYDQSLPAKNLPFPSCGRRVSPIQAASCHLQSGHGECLPATQLYLSVFTCPIVSLDLPLDAGESLPARQSYFSCLYLSNTASLNLPLDAGEVLPARQSYFSCLYLSNTASLKLPLDAGEVPPARQTLFRLLAPKISNPVERDIPGRFGNLSFQSTTGEVRPPGSQVSISCQMPQEPPGWTTSPFPPSSAKLTHQTGGHAHQLDVG